MGKKATRAHGSLSQCDGVNFDHDGPRDINNPPIRHMCKREDGQAMVLDQVDRGRAQLSLEQFAPLSTSVSLLEDDSCKRNGRLCRCLKVKLYIQTPIGHFA